MRRNGCRTGNRTVEAYDVQSDTWSVKPSLLIPVLDAFGATVDNKLYVIGGYTLSGMPTDAVQEYDPVTDTWTMKTPMLTPRSQLSGAVINNKIYVVGDGPACITVSELSVVDLNGRVVANFKSPDNILDLQCLPKGIYIVKLTGDKGNQIEKIFL